MKAPGRGGAYQLTAEPRNPSGGVDQSPYLDLSNERLNACSSFMKVVPYVLSFANTIYMQLIRTYKQFIIEFKSADLPYGPNLTKRP